MINFTGEYDCKVDAKGRIMLPIAFRKQMGEVAAYCFVVKKDLYASCLELYTADEWEQQNNLIMSNYKPFDPESKQFIRDFKMGATEVECDPTGRILLPRRLLTQVEITDEALLSGSIGKIDIWSPTLYEESGGDADARRKRAKRVMGDVTYNTEKL